MISLLVRANNYKKQGIVDESIIEIIETEYGKILEQGYRMLDSIQSAINNAPVNICLG